jgi:uncharacterized protein YdaU (DUF1376 family)
MTPPKSPAFRFYPADFMGSPDVQAMDLHEVGAYLYLLCMAWQSDRHGYLPDDDEKLRRWAHMNREQWDQSREILLGKFPIVEEDWRANPRMVREADKQAAFSESQRQKANVRWGRPEKPGESQNDAGAQPGHTEENAGGIPSVSASVSVFASDTASGDKDKNISVPSKPHPDAALSGDSGKGPQLVSVDRQRSEKRKRPQDPVKPYEPRFLAAYELYPKHEEKSASEAEWHKAHRRLQKGERDKPQMTPDEAAEFIEKASADFAQKMADREPQYIRSMRRWLRDSNYLEYEPKPRTTYRVLTEEEAAEQWNRDFGLVRNG